MLFDFGGVTDLLSEHRVHVGKSDSMLKPTHHQHSKRRKKVSDRCKGKKQRSDYLAKIVKELIRIRIEKGITQGELNQKLGYSEFLVTKWETGIRTPSSFALYNWAAALGAEITVAANDNNI
jgi:ribosome-binding protein aMBF1 (putative translation factor)